MKRMLLLLFVLLSLCAQAQTEDEPLQVFNDMTCYDDYKALGLQEKRIDMDGKVFNLMIEHDSVGVNIIVSDKDELQKLSDRISHMRRLAFKKGLVGLLIGKQ